MTILYSLVARGSVVLAEFSSTITNASAIARQILEKIPGEDESNVSYSQDRFIFHVKRTDGLTVLCMADESAGLAESNKWDSKSVLMLRVCYVSQVPEVTLHVEDVTPRQGTLGMRLTEERKLLSRVIESHIGRIPFAFLEDIHGRFVKTYGRAVHNALAYAMNDEFSRILSQQMDYYANDPNADRINRLKGEMTQVRNVMIENIDKVLERGDRLELLVDKTATMQGNTVRFKKQARRFKNNVWWRNAKLTCALILVLLIIIYIVLAFSCHGLALPSCI